MRKFFVLLFMLGGIFLLGYGLYLFSQPIYSVEFTNFDIENQKVRKGEYAKKPKDPEKEGYVFIGWFENDKLFDLEKTPITHNVKLFGKFESELTDDIYTITFNTDGGSIIEEQKVNGNGKVKKPINPTKDEYVFVEWQYNEKVFDFENYKVTSDMELKAIWKEKGKITITFDSNGGSVVSSQSIKAGETIKKPENPTKKDNKFVSWQKNGIDFDFSTKLEEDTTLVAKWEEYITYTVIFKNGDKEYKKLEVEKDKTVAKPANPTQTGKEFVEWDLNGIKYDFSSKVTSDITLTAKFIDKKKYTVTFNSNGGSKVDTKTVYENDKVTAPNKPTKSGYTFKEWQLNGKKYDFNAKVTSNITLNAIWLEDAKYKDFEEYFNKNNLKSKYPSNDMEQIAAKGNSFTYTLYVNNTTDSPTLEEAKTDAYEQKCAEKINNERSSIIKQISDWEKDSGLKGIAYVYRIKYGEYTIIEKTIKLN